MKITSVNGMSLHGVTMGFECTFDIGISGGATSDLLGSTTDGIAESLNAFVGGNFIAVR